MKRKRGSDEPGRAAKDPLALYRRIRRPMPPPERIVEDRRRKADEEEARREIRGEE